ncbi:hypothetical protein G7046_g9919 [Stylonectria norvegica]|nr:hypothetical protein G7046_g9919 [Stylonectria norvegica]
MSSDMMIGSSLEYQGIQKLETQLDWIDWIMALRGHARSLGVWEKIDPETPDRPSDRANLPVYETFNQLKDRMDREQQPTKDVTYPDLAGGGVSTTGNTPVREQAPRLPPPSDERVLAMHQALSRDATHELAVYKELSQKMRSISNYINKTVDSGIYEAVVNYIADQDPGFSNKQIVKALQARLAPSMLSTTEEIRRQYRDVLKEAFAGRTKPEVWYSKWSKAHTRGQAYNIPEVSGLTATTDFLDAVGNHYASAWAETERNSLLKLSVNGQDNTDVTVYGAWFQQIINIAPKTKRPGIFASLGGQREAGNACLCGRSHPWKPESCKHLEYVITGKPNHLIKTVISAAQKAEIKKLYHDPANAKLRALIAAQGWGKPSGNRDVRFDFNATTLNPKLLYNVAQSVGIYASLAQARHPLSESTLFDNCGAVHLVNSIDRLVKGSFIPDSEPSFVEAGTTQCRVLGKGKRFFPALFDNETGDRRGNLTIDNVVVVEGFHTNIVSEALLRNVGIWYHGYDCSLRTGAPEESVFLRQLTRDFNVCFLEYKPLSTCSVTSSDVRLREIIPISNAGIQMSVSAWEHNLKPKAKPHRPSRDPPRPRTDSEHLWHLRAGHLGKDALRELARHARYVRFSGLTSEHCEICATTYTHQVISRRTSEQRAIRPFQRVLWDLQVFNRGYEGSNYLLVMKDEYSGMLWCRPIVHKDAATILAELAAFDNWVTRQFGLYLGTYRSDNEPAAIARRGKTEYQKWTKAVGIEIENPPPDTHESNGGIEIANKQIANRSNAMIRGAHLPEELWPESTRAAVHLINISPSRKHGWMSPKEAMYHWFKYKSPLGTMQIREHTAHLDPDWSGVYAYGCRAYPLVREREGNQDRKNLKTSPRGHIGYLVGYEATNIYRIWIPRLERVVKTRNVQFNEEIFYNPHTERATEPSLIQLNDWVLTIEEDDAPDTYEAEDLPIRALQPLQLNSGVEAHNDGTLAVQRAKSPMQAPSHTQEGLQTPRETPEPEAHNAHTGSLGGAHTSTQGHNVAWGVSDDLAAPEVDYMDSTQDRTPLDNQPQHQRAAQEAEEGATSLASPEMQQTLGESTPSINAQRRKQRRAQQA